MKPPLSRWFHYTWLFFWYILYRIFTLAYSDSCSYDVWRFLDSLLSRCKKFFL